MKLAHLVLVLTAVLMTACITREVQPEAPEKVPAAKPAPPKAPAKAAPAKESVKEVPKVEVAPESEVVAASAVSAPGAKFAKLKIGMTLDQVEKLIGPPTSQSTHATEKASIAFYFGPDRWVIEYAYKGEGVLTFNSGGEKLLTQIEVNKAK